MTMTTSGQIMPWPDYLRTKRNVNIKVWDLREILIVYILVSTFQSVHMVLTVNKPDVRRFIAWIESADWNPCIACHQCRSNHLSIRLAIIIISGLCAHAVDSMSIQEQFWACKLSLSIVVHSNKQPLGQEISTPPILSIKNYFAKNLTNMCRK